MAAEVGNREERMRRAGEFCPLCGSRGDDWSEVHDSRACIHRSIAFSSPVLLSWQWPDIATYEAWYADPTAYHVEEQIAQGQQPFHRRRNEHIDAAHSRWQAITGLGSKRGPVLDIGCGDGSFVAAVRWYGVDAWGLEPNPRLPGDNPDSNYIFTGTWQDAFPFSVDSGWEVITMFDVFEHLTDPRGCLRRLRSILGASGVLVVEMPELPPDPALWATYRHLRPKQHVCLYSQGAAEQLYREEGFRIVGFYRPLLGSIGKMSHFLVKEG